MSTVLSSVMRFFCVFYSVFCIFKEISPFLLERTIATFLTVTLSNSNDNNHHLKRVLHGAPLSTALLRWSVVLVAQLWPTLCDPMDCSPPPLRCK